MSALPTPQPESRRKPSKKQAARAIARLLEDHMNELGLSEADKNARTAAFAESVKKLKTARSGSPSK
jgi:hypothetical protein